MAAALDVVVIVFVVNSALHFFSKKLHIYLIIISKEDIILPKID